MNIPTTNQLLFKYYQLEPVGREEFVIALADHVINLIEYAQARDSIVSQTDTCISKAKSFIERIAK